MKNNLIAFGLTLLTIVATVLLASVLYQFDMIRQVLIVMWMIISSVWVFLSMREIVKRLRQLRGFVQGFFTVVLYNV